MLVLAAVMSDTAHAQAPIVRPEWFSRAWQTWWGAGHVILPSAADVQYAQSHGDIDWSRDWAAAVEASLAADPFSAADRCALLVAMNAHPQAISQGRAGSLFIRETEICKKHPPLEQRVGEAAAFMFPPPPSRRAVIAAQTTNPQPDRYAAAYGIYSPPPATNWLESDPAGRDYRTDVQAAFDRDPIVVAHVCRSAMQPVSAPLTARQQRLHTILLEVCAAFPDAKIEAAAGAQKATQSREWLNGLLNASLDQAAALTDVQRRRESARAVAAFPNVSGSSARFQNAVRAFAFTPDDLDALAAVLRYETEASFNSRGGATVEDVRSWLRDQIETRSRAGRDSLAWKRAWRNYLMATGDVMRARNVAREVAAAHPDDQHTRDVIIAAMLERAAGNRNPYDRLLSSCPPPDASYLESHARPASQSRFCEDVIGDIARAVRDATRTPPAAIAAMAVESSRVEPAAMPPVSVSVQRPQSSEPALQDEFAAFIKRAADRVAPLTRLQREQQALQLEEKTDNGHAIPLESAVYLAFLEPWHDSGAAALLMAASRRGDGARVRALVQPLYEERAAHGPDSDEWRRGLRAFLLYSGQYERARNLAAEIAAHTSAQYRDRDVMMAATAEFLAGNRESFARAVSGCPGASSENEERWGLKMTKRDYCRGFVVWFAARAITASGNLSPHAGYQELLRDIAGNADDDQVRVFALLTLSRIAPAIADPEFRAFLLRPHIDQDSRRKALWQLGFDEEMNKNWSEAARLLDELLALEYPTIPGFSAALWAQLAVQPEGAVRNFAAQGDEYERRLMIALRLNDFATARRLIEDGLALNGFPAQVRYWMLELAAAEARTGLRAEPLRILGYIATQPLDKASTEKLAEVRTLLATESSPAPEPQRQATPWDTPPRPQRIVPAKPPSTVKT